jgi:hypothetical protein
LLQVVLDTATDYSKRKENNEKRLMFFPFNNPAMLSLCLSRADLKSLVTSLSEFLDKINLPQPQLLSFPDESPPKDR